LRKELEEGGHRFLTKSDTEVIVHLYEDLGPSCVERLRGMFAFAIWSEKEKRLLLVRDRIGQKPLNYVIESGGLTFSSEIRPLLVALDIKREINLEALNDYLTYMYVPSPKTIFKGIRKLPPGHIMIVEKGDVKIERYWDLDFSEKLKMKESDYAERIMELLKEATSLRLIGDVPFGAFLSGGIDSSVIVGIMTQLMDQPVKTFSIGFDIRSYNELQYAKLVVRQFGTDHHEFEVNPSAIDILPKLTLHYGEPFSDSSSIPTYYLSKFTREYVTVTLNGDGGDELFAGYNRYHEWTLVEKVLKRLNEFTEGERKVVFRDMIKRAGEASVGEKTFLKYANWIIENWNLTPGERYAMWMSTFTTRHKRLLYSDEMKRGLERLESTTIVEHFNNSKARDLLDKALWVDIMTYLPEDLLVKIDIASMAMLS
jgi:asparagine synthase (glutamine-hydrolysing)